jgi:hypothetical protein
MLVKSFEMRDAVAAVLSALRSVPKSAPVTLLAIAPDPANGREGSAELATVLVALPVDRDATAFEYVVWSANLSLPSVHRGDYYMTLEAGVCGFAKRVMATGVRG